MKAKTKFTRLWSVLLVLVMVVGMIPIAALATGSVAATADFTSGDGSAALALLNAAKTEGAADSVWDSTTNTLTLNGVNFETTAATAVKLPDGSTIVLNGVNTIKGVGSSSEDSYGIYADGALTIQGTGTLNVTGGDTSSRSCGIYANNGNVIISGGTITATGGTSGRASLGIYSYNNGKNVEISGGTVTATGGTATDDGSFGINAEGEVKISGGKVKAIGGAGKGSDGLYSGNGQINISGGKVEAFGGDAPSAGGSVGIFAQTPGANVQISGTADVTARGGKSASDRSYGIYSINPVTISGGKVEAFGGEGRYPGYGINKANISGGTVTAASEDGDAINNVTTGSGFKTISFDRNGGSGEMIAYTNADSYILPANGFTAPADKEFMGWSKSSTGDVIEDTTVKATDGKTLYAIWKINVADFNADPTAALALLNAAKTADAADSVWDSTTNTLTLNGVDFTTTAATAMRLPADSTIVLNGVNTIKGGDAESGDCYGIYTDGSLTISGSGTLDVTGGTATGNSHGIYATNGLSISGTATVTAKGGAAGYYSYGIGSDTTIDISGGTVYAEGGGTSSANSFGLCGIVVTISGADVTAIGGTAAKSSSYGLLSVGNVTISGTAKVKATGGTAKDDSCGICAYNNVSIEDGIVTATGGTAGSGYDSCGIYANAGLTISGTAKVEATGGEATNGNSYGIYSNRDAKISGGTTRVTATGGKAIYSCGIYSSYGSITISGGTVTAKGGEATYDNGYSKGISSLYAIEISDGTVTAEGGKAVYSYGIYSSDSSITISDGTVTAKGGAATNKSYGIIAPGSAKIMISGGTVTAEAGAAPIASALNKTPSVSSNPYWWRISESGDYTQSSDSAYTFDSDHTYLEIKEPEYTVTVTNGTASPSQAAAGATVTLTANTAPSGQVFDKWIVNGVVVADANSATTTFVMPAGNVTAEATYKNIPVVTYTVTFEANGGSGSMAAVTGVLGTYTLPENGFTAPEGKQFKAWSVNGKEKAVGDKITVTADTTVKAVWENIPAAPIEYEILEGANSKWTQDSDGNLSVRGNGAFSKFVGVKVDGKSVDEKYYTVKEGSTIVTLKADYLNTLTVGSHTLEIVWTDGSASTAFTVSAQTVVESPQTGDNSMMALWIAVLFVSGIGVMGTTIYIRKKKYSVK